MSLPSEMTERALPGTRLCLVGPFTVMQALDTLGRLARIDVNTPVTIDFTRACPVQEEALMALGSGFPHLRMKRVVTAGLRSSRASPS